MVLSRSLFTLSLVVALVGDPYVLTVHLPEGYRVKTAEIDGEKAGTENLGHTGIVRITPSATGTVNWRIAFAK